jgi:hypothetical protein
MNQEYKEIEWKPGGGCGRRHAQSRQLLGTQTANILCSLLPWSNGTYGRIYFRHIYSDKLEVRVKESQYMSWQHMGFGGVAPLILVLSTRCKWGVSFMPPQIFLCGKSFWHPLNRGLGGAQSWSGCCWEEKNLLPLPGTEPKRLRFPAGGLVIILTMLPALTCFDKWILTTASNSMTTQTDRAASLLTTYVSHKPIKGVTDYKKVHSHFLPWSWTSAWTALTPFGSLTSLLRYTTWMVFWPWYLSTLIIPCFVPSDQYIRSSNSVRREGDGTVWPESIAICCQHCFLNWIVTQYI